VTVLHVRPGNLRKQGEDDGEGNDQNQHVIIFRVTPGLALMFPIVQVASETALNTAFIRRSARLQMTCGTRVSMTKGLERNGRVL
jgi:hypothetical protein